MATKRLLRSSFGGFEGAGQRGIEVLGRWVDFQTARRFAQIRRRLPPSAPSLNSWSGTEQ
jgi:hypothetical protein